MSDQGTPFTRGMIPDLVARRRMLFQRGAPGYAAGSAFPDPGADAAWLAPPSVTVPLPEVFPAPAADYFSTFGSLPALGAGAPTIIPGTQFELPANSVAVVRAFTVAINNMIPTTAVRFTLYVDGSPTRIRVQPFGRNAPSYEAAYGGAEVLYRIGDGATFEWRAEVLDGGVYQVGASLWGWFYPIELAAAAAEAWG